MKIFVPIKRVPDYETKIKVKADRSGFETEGIKWIVNPFDEIAVEEALKLKEAGAATEVVVVCIGPSDAQQQLRYAMAMGADSAIQVVYDGAVDSDLAARILAKVYAQGEYGLIIMGKQAIDSDSGQTGAILSHLLGFSQATFASKVELAADSATVTREVDGGLETIKVPLPAVITTDLRLNTPRYASLPGIMKAKKKPLTEIAIDSLGVTVAPKIVVKGMHPPEGRKGGKKVGSVAELISALQNEAKVL